MRTILIFLVVAAFPVWWVLFRTRKDRTRR